MSKIAAHDVFFSLRAIKFEATVFFILGIIIYLLTEWLTQPPLNFLILLGYISGAALWVIGRVRYLLLKEGVNRVAIKK